MRLGIFFEYHFYCLCRAKRKFLSVAKLDISARLCARVCVCYEIGIKTTNVQNKNRNSFIVKQLEVRSRKHWRKAHEKSVQRTKRFPS